MVKITQAEQTEEKEILKYENSQTTSSIRTFSYRDPKRKRERMVDTLFEVITAEKFPKLGKGYPGPRNTKSQIRSIERERDP